MKDLKMYTFVIEDASIDEHFEEVVFETSIKDAYSHILKWKEGIPFYTVTKCYVSSIQEGRATYEEVEFTKI